MEEADGSVVTLHLQNRTFPSEHEVASRYGARQTGYMEELLRCPKIIQNTLLLGEILKRK